VTMPQLLHLQNGESVVRKIGAGDGRLAGLLKSGASDDQVIEELFLTTLSRKPNAEAIAVVKKSLAQEKRDEVFRDLFWALLNSKESAFTHGWRAGRRKPAVLERDQLKRISRCSISFLEGVKPSVTATPVAISFVSAPSARSGCPRCFVKK